MQDWIFRKLWLWFLAMIQEIKGLRTWCFVSLYYRYFYMFLMNLVFVAQENLHYIIVWHQKMTLREMILVDIASTEFNGKWKHSLMNTTPFRGTDLVTSIVFILMTKFLSSWRNYWNQMRTQRSLVCSHVAGGHFHQPKKFLEVR